MLNQFKLMAEHNQLMNQRLYSATASLSDIEIKEDKGAFFKSIFGTLNHILVGDILWLSRFSNTSLNQETLSYLTKIEKPKSLDALLFDEFHNMKKERENIDKIIIAWIYTLSDQNFSTVIAYQNMKGIESSKHLSGLLNHLFLHQVHHRGQATTLLSQAGVDFGDTDLIEIIPESM